MTTQVTAMMLGTRGSGKTSLASQFCHGFVPDPSFLSWFLIPGDHFRKRFNYEGINYDLELLVEDRALLKKSSQDVVNQQQRNKLSQENFKKQVNQNHVSRDYTVGNATSKRRLPQEQQKKQRRRETIRKANLIILAYSVANLDSFNSLEAIAKEVFEVKQVAFPAPLDVSSDYDDDVNDTLTKDLIKNILIPSSAASSTTSTTNHHLKPWDSHKIPILVIGTKLDLDSLSRRQVPSCYGASFASRLNAIFLECSSTDTFSTASVFQSAVSWFSLISFRLSSKSLCTPTSSSLSPPSSSSSCSSTPSCSSNSLSSSPSTPSSPSSSASPNGYPIFSKSSNLIKHQTFHPCLYSTSAPMESSIPSNHTNSSFFPSSYSHDFRTFFLTQRNDLSVSNACKLTSDIQISLLLKNNNSGTENTNNTNLMYCHFGILQTNFSGIFDVFEEKSKKISKIPNPNSQHLSYIVKYEMEFETEGEKEDFWRFIECIYSGSTDPHWSDHILYRLLKISDKFRHYSLSQICDYQIHNDSSKNVKDSNSLKNEIAKKTEDSSEEKKNKKNKKKKNQIKIKEKIQLGIGVLYNLDLFSDIQFISRKSKTNICFAHKSILAARCLYFRSLFEDNSTPNPLYSPYNSSNVNKNMNRNMEIIELDLNKSLIKAFKWIIKYLYTDLIWDTGLEECCLEVYELSKVYGLQSLACACENIMIEGITKDNVCDILNWSEVQGVETVKRASEWYCADHLDLVQLTEGWELRMKQEQKTRIVGKTSSVRIRLGQMESVC